MSNKNQLTVIGSFLSTRKFKITFFDREDVKEITVNLNQLLGISQDDDFSETEMQFSLHEVIDRVLDLRPFERLCFQEDRSDSNTLAIIIRIQ